MTTQQQQLKQMEKTQFQAIIFDHDGTLVDSEGIHWECWNNVLADFGVALDFDDYRTLYNGLPTLDTAAKIKRQFELTTSEDELYRRKISLLNQKMSEAPFPLLPGAIDILSWLHKKAVPVAIASGANRQEVMRSVEAHKLNQFVSIVSTKQDVSRSKPAPDVYLDAATKLNAPPNQCIAIEDSDTGEASARAAGMFCLRITPNPIGNHHIRNLNEGMNHIRTLLLLD